WTGMIGGTFLALSYFGTDQSQVQRYLSGRSVKEMQLGLIFNGLLKVPMQFFILLVGVMVFVFYQFNQAPLNFNPAAQEAVLNSVNAEEYKELMQANELLQEEKQETVIRFGQSLNTPSISEDKIYSDKMRALDAAEVLNRERARELIKASSDKVETNDKDYVFIHFILNNLPKGLIGLLLAVILSA